MRTKKPKMSLGAQLRAAKRENTLLRRSCISLERRAVLAEESLLLADELEAREKHLGQYVAELTGNVDWQADELEAHREVVRSLAMKIGKYYGTENEIKEAFLPYNLDEEDIEIGHGTVRELVVDAIGIGFARERLS